MSIEELYPQSCPFCIIAAAYPAPESPSLSATSSMPKTAETQVFRHEAITTTAAQLRSAVPETVDVRKVEPNCFLVLSAPEVLAFLDIMPMTRAHLLVVAREHREKIGDVNGREARDLGKSFPSLEA